MVCVLYGNYTAHCGHSPTRTRDEPLNSGARCLVFQALTTVADHPNLALEGPKIGPQAGPEAQSVKGRSEGQSPPVAGHARRRRGQE